MEEETKDEQPKEQPKKENEILVVDVLPQASLRVGTDSITGETLNLITRDEALTEILKSMREIKGGLLGK